MTGIEIPIILICTIIIIYLFFKPNKQMEQPQPDKGDIADIISSFNKQMAEAKPLMEWEYRKMTALQIFELFKRIETAEIHISHYVYSTPEGYDVFFRYKQEDSEKFKTLILNDI